MSVSFPVRPHANLPGGISGGRHLAPGYLLLKCEHPRKWSEELIKTQALILWVWREAHGPVCVTSARRVRLTLLGRRAQPGSRAGWGTPPKHKAQLVSTFLVDSGNVSTALYESAAYNNSPRLKKPVISDSIVMGP